MIWKKEFDLTSLNQGYALCRTNCVSLGIQEKNYIQAVVKDKTVQHVAIDMSLPNHFVMSCDCPRYSRTNPRYCRHMAAVLYYAEVPSEEVSEKAPEPLHRVANPFAKGGPFYAAKAPGEGYRYFRAENFTASFPFFREQIEEARAILAEKSRTGFRAEVKALLSAHGVRQLSDVTDPAQLSAIVAEAEVIGNG